MVAAVVMRELTSYLNLTDSRETIGAKSFPKDSPLMATTP